MLIFRNKLILLILLTVCFRLSSQADESDFQVNTSLKFKTLSKLEGLSQNWVRCVYEDNQGFIWFGTSGGLNKYNAYEFKKYKLGSVNVNDIDKKSDHELWICNDLGVFIYNQLLDSISSLKQFDGQTVINALQENDTTVWFGTNTGLFRYNTSNNQLHSYYIDDDVYSGTNINYINILFQDAAKNIWIGTKEGLNRYVRSSDSFVNYRYSSQSGSISGNDIMAICEDHDQNIWVGTAKNGLNLMIKNREGEIEFKKIVDGAILSLMADQQNNLWIGRSSNGGLLQLDLNSFSLDSKPHIVQFKKSLSDPGSLSDNSIFCIYQDKLEDIWIGTIGGGVSYLTKRGKKIHSVKEGINIKPDLKNDMVNAILEEEQYFWFGTEGGLDRYDKQTGTSHHFSYESANPVSLASDPVYELCKDSRGNLWIGTWAGGLNLFNYRNNTFIRFSADGKPGSINSENVFAICEDSRGSLWVGTVGGGLNRYDYQSGTFTSYRNDPQNPKSLFVDIIHDIIETHDGRLLIASYGSLDVFNYDSEDFTHYPLNAENSDVSNRKFIISIFQDSQHNIWLSTNEGLILFTNEKFSRIYTSRDGLPSDKIQGMLEDANGNLWVSTNNGLSEFVGALANPQSPEFINFDKADGLAANDFQARAVYKDKTGMLFFGTSKGYSYFHPDSIMMNRTIPEIVFVEMELLQKKTSKTGENSLVRNINGIDKIELAYNESDFVITFAALNYLNPEKNQYKYKLEGYDSEWINAGSQRQATYKNLSPGKYTLMVLGSNNDNTWSKIPRILEIVVLPPFWKTLWFQSLLVLLSIGVLVLFYWLRIRRVEREKKKLSNLVNERTTELEQANVTLAEQSEELSCQNEELMQSKKELSDNRDHLEEEVMSRTMDLEEAKNRAEESDRLKSAFLANMSHEIRTPLNAIAGFTSILNDPDLEYEDRASYMRIVNSNTKTLLRLIDDILDLSVIEADHVVIKLTQFAPIKIIKEIHQQFLPQIAESVEFLVKVDIAHQLAIISSDEHRFRQVITNLVANAIKFTEKGYIEIGFKDHSDDHLVFYVKDSGIGISKEEQKTIFNQFRKIEDTAKLYRGAGLGLAISRRLSNLLKGEIWIESEPGKGSSFFFTQPIAK